MSARSAKSVKSARQDNNKGYSLLLEGTQVIFEERNFRKYRKSFCNSIMPLRPVSASNTPNIYKKNSAVKLKRPLSADNIFYDNMNEEYNEEPSKDISNLPSTQILKCLLNENISHPWENNYENSCSTDSDKSLGVKIKQITERSISDPALLVPGIKSKPPLPEKNKKKIENSLHLNLNPQDEIQPELEQDVLEDLDDSDKLDSTSNESNSTHSFKNWIQENKNLILETKLLETQTDIELQNVHKHQEDLTGNIFNNNEEQKSKRTLKTKPKKPAIYRTEFKQKKPQKEIKKPVKSILKPPNNTNNKKSIPKEETDDNIISWMSSGKHENFLEFLNKLDDIEDDESKSGPLSQRSYLQDKPVHDNDKNMSSTCDEIASILEVLEQEDLKSQKSIECYKEIINSELPECKLNNNINNNLDSTRCSSTSSLDSASNYNDFLSYLEEVDKSCVKTLQTAKERIKSVTKVTNSVLNNDNVPKLEELINYSTVDLSHYIINLSIRLKEKSSGIQTLQTEIQKLRNHFTSKLEESDKQLKQKLKNQKDEYEPVIKRHQKFIDQLIADKKALNTQCEGLINEIKVLEDRYNTNIKTIEHRHKIELQKAKEMHLAAEKIRRDKWIEGKTAKIKEITLKGLEPELQSMQNRQQQEISDLRSLHKQELEELELKAARKSQQQCEALRQQLTLEREQAIAHEREILRQRLEKLVESEEKSYQELRRRLNAEHSARLSEIDERIVLITNEKERAIESAKIDYEDKLQTAIRKHKTELKNFKDSMDLEMEVWKNNFKKQQNIKMAEVEGHLREVSKKERDKEIEIVIERLEREQEEMKSQLEQASDNRIRRLKEKYESEIKDLESIATEYKGKYSDRKEKLLVSEDNILNLKTNIKQLEMQLQNAKQITDEYNMNKTQIKNQIKEEFITDIKSMQEEIKYLKNNREEEMQKIFAKVKLTVTHKDELLSEMSRNNSNLQEKCTLLENLLEQQRKEYLIK